MSELPKVTPTKYKVDDIVSLKGDNSSPKSMGSSKTDHRVYKIIGIINHEGTIEYKLKDENDPHSISIKKTIIVEESKIHKVHKKGGRRLVRSRRRSKRRAGTRRRRA